MAVNCVVPCISTFVLCKNFQGFRGKEFLSSPPCPDRLLGQPRLLSNAYQGFFPWG